MAHKFRHLSCARRWLPRTKKGCARSSHVIRKENDMPALDESFEEFLKRRESV